MWFMIRTVFWLSIVFASISGPEGRILTLSSIAQEIEGILSFAAGRLRSAAEKACSADPLACAGAAASAGQFLEGQNARDRDKPLRHRPAVDAASAAN